jgi:DNA-directed RNA polymerase subunit RPC12/RpoP
MSEENVNDDFPASANNVGEEAEVSGHLELLAICWNCGFRFLYKGDLRTICPNCGSALNL